jgi:hypothetical protein
MTNRERLLMQKNAEFGYDETERIKADKINRLIRRRYSVSAELAVIRQRDTKPEEFEAYFAYVEACKEKVKIDMAVTSIDESLKSSLLDEYFSIHLWLASNDTTTEEANAKIERQDVIKALLGIGGIV